MKCLCCESETFENLDYINQDFPDTEIFDELVILICSNCGFGFLATDPTSDEINNFYISEYRKKGSPHQLDFGKLGSLKNIDTRSFAQLATGISFVDFKPFDAFLDLGPGNGNSFATANLLLPNPRLYGIELNSGAVDFYRVNYNAICFENLEEIVSKEKLFKVILLSHSLEHIRKDDLIIFISQLRKIISEDGICILEVPNDDFRKKELQARSNDSPHLLFFSVDAIKKLLTKSGFEVIYLKVLGNPRFFNKPNFGSAEKDLAQKIRIAISQIRILRKFLKNLKERLLHRVVRFIEINPKGFTDSLLNQFIVDDSRDCIRIIIRILK